MTFVEYMTEHITRTTNTQCPNDCCIKLHWDRNHNPAPQNPKTKRKKKKEGGQNHKEKGVQWKRNGQNAELNVLI